MSGTLRPRRSRGGNGNVDAVDVRDEVHQAQDAQHQVPDLQKTLHLLAAVPEQMSHAGIEAVLFGTAPAISNRSPACAVPAGHPEPGFKIGRLPEPSGASA